MKSLIVLFLGAVLVLFTGLTRKESRMSNLTLLVLTLALAFTVIDFGGWLPWDFEKRYIPPDMLFFNRISLAFVAILIAAAIFVIGLFKQRDFMGADLLGLLLFSLCGAVIMTSFNHLVILFIGLEALSIPLYVLAGSDKLSLKSNESAIKYFLMGAFSSAVFLMGCAFIYGATGGLDMSSLYYVADKMNHMGASSSLFNVGIALLMIGLCFKISAVPFHFWSPDVYEGSPNRTTVFMATIVKVAAFAACFRIFSLVLTELKVSNWGMMLAVISALTIITGNVAALVQTSVKRTLAYSGVAHAGYMILAILSVNKPVPGGFQFPIPGYHALLIYSIAYVAANAILFYYFHKISAKGDESFEAFSGLASNNKFAAFLITISMFSLAGIPITAGFIGKYHLFTAVFQEYTWLVFIALVGSAVSIAYYFRIFKNVFFTDGDAAVKETVSEKLLLVIAALCILAIGAWPAIITGIDFLQVR